MQLLCSKHSVFCLWEVRWKDDLPSCLQCVFSANFSPLKQDVSAFKPFHYQFQLERVTVSPLKYLFCSSLLEEFDERSCDRVVSSSDIYIFKRVFKKRTTVDYVPGLRKD